MEKLSRTVKATTSVISRLRDFGDTPLTLWICDKSMEYHRRSAPGCNEPKCVTKHLIKRPNICLLALDVTVCQAKLCET